MSTALLVVGHGSRAPRANDGFEAFVRAYADHVGARFDEVTHAYVELAAPHVEQALAALAARHQRVVLLPLFLFLVGHTKTDLPLALARARDAFPAVDFVAARELGVHPRLLDITFDRAAATSLSDPARTVAVVVGRGASDPDANGELYRLARLFGEGRGFKWVVPCFLGIATPLVPETLDLVARLRPERLVAVPYLLFDGRLADKLRAQVAAFAAQYPWIGCAVAAPLAPDVRLFDVLDERWQSALAGVAPLPCDTCQYRAPIAGVSRNVGGLRALLYSIRHSLTHQQAAPHPHAHRALTRHVLVCGNVDCAASGSIALLEGLRQRVRTAGRTRDIRITRTSCMGRCGEGPTVAVYPDGVWYRGVRADDADEIVREHLLGDRLVGRLIDNIMQ